MPWTKLDRTGHPGGCLKPRPAERFLALRARPARAAPDRGRPAEQQYAVHGRDRAEQPPALDGNDVAVAESGIVDKGEVQDVLLRRSGIHDEISHGPYHHLGDMGQ
jgi:hypothetical protein